MLTAARGVMALMLTLSATGCAVTYQQGAPPSFQGVAVQPELETARAKLEREGERNWVLNLNALALAAMRRGDRDTAVRALDEAILQIEIIYGDSEQARRARSLWFAEEQKIFKGDPYERSMTYFYRGVLFMQEGEWDNARAMFRSAILQDSFAEEGQNQNDWALFHYLVGVCQMQLNRPQLAEESFGRAEALYDGFRQRYADLSGTVGEAALGRKSRLTLAEDLPPFTRETNVLVLTQHGVAPRKIAAGQYGSVLAYAPGGKAEGTAFVHVEDAEAQAVVADSIYYQAATRGGRGLDPLLQKQASIRSVTQTMGEAATASGAAVTVYGAHRRDEDVALAGAGLVLAGFAVQGFSQLIQPQADTRAWRGLPDAIGVATATAPTGLQAVDVAYFDLAGNVTGEVTVEAPVPAPGEGLAVFLTFPPPAISLEGPAPAAPAPPAVTELTAPN